MFKCRAVVGVVIALLLISCSRSNNTDIEAKLKHSVEHYEQEVKSPTNTPKFQQTLDMETLRALEHASIASLSKPVIASALIINRKDGQGVVFVNWIEATPTVRAIIFKIPGNSQALEIDIDDEINNYNKELSKNGVVFGMSYVLTADNDKWKRLQSYLQSGVLEAVIVTKTGVQSQKRNVVMILQ